MTGEVEQVLVVRKVRAATVYKLLALGLLISFIPLGILFGAMGLFGADTVKWNNEPIHGVFALFAGPAISIFVALLFTGLLGTLACLGLWLFSKFRPIRIRFVSLGPSTLQAQQSLQVDGSASGGPAA